MKISSYNLGMESTSTMTKTLTYERKAVGGSIGTLTNMLGNFAGMFDRDVLAKEDEETETLVNEAAEDSEVDNTSGSLQDILGLMQSNSPASRLAKTNRTTYDDPYAALDKFRQQLIKYLEELFNKGKKVKDKWNDCYETDDTRQQLASQSEGAYITYEETYTYSEEASYSFSTTGTVVNSEGQEISFNLDVSMSRSFYAEYGRTIEHAVSFCDPLVINLDGDLSKISDQKFFFDLDADGTEEEISYFGKGTGLLALDLNEDGKINDGSELFGTKSGNGFADLARYDLDRNGWIDENDDIWDKVKIWIKGEDGTDELYSLANKGVGAIYLGNTRGDYLYKGSDNVTNARVRASGMFLYESGMAGTVQQIDLAR